MLGLSIEDVERGAELSFSGPLRGVRFADPPLHHPIVKFCLNMSGVYEQNRTNKPYTAVR